MNEVKCSIVLPLFNGAAYVGETLESIAAQTYQDAELVVVDDGSTDGSAALVEQVCRASASPILSRLLLVTQANQGVAAARNAGIAAARGSWIALIDQDDLWLPGKLYAQVRALEANPSFGWHYTAFTRFYNDGREVAKTDGAPGRLPTWRRLIAGDLFIPPAASLVRKSVCDAVGGFDSAVIPSDDWDFFLKLCARFECGYFAEQLVRFRSHPQSTGKRQRARIFEAQLVVLDRHGEAARAVMPARLVRHRRANILWHFGREHAAAGNYAAARTAFRHAVALHPWRMKLVGAWLGSMMHGGGGSKGDG